LYEKVGVKSPIVFGHFTKSHPGATTPRLSKLLFLFNFKSNTFLAHILIYVLTDYFFEIIKFIFSLHFLLDCVNHRHSLAAFSSLAAPTMYCAVSVSFDLENHEH